jgi:hypothetical protein
MKLLSVLMRSLAVLAVSLPLISGCGESEKTETADEPAVGVGLPAGGSPGAVAAKGGPKSAKPEAKAPKGDAKGTPAAGESAPKK